MPCEHSLQAVVVCTSTCSVAGKRTGEPRAKRAAPVLNRAHPMFVLWAPQGRLLCVVTHTYLPRPPFFPPSVDPYLVVSTTAVVRDTKRPIFSLSFAQRRLGRCPFVLVLMIPEVFMDFLLVERTSPAIFVTSSAGWPLLWPGTGYARTYPSPPA